MIYPEATKEEWAERWGLPLGKEFTCPKCKGVFPVDVPIYLRDTAGFESRKHEPCGPDMTSVILTPRTKAAKDLFRKLLS